MDALIHPWLCLSHIVKLSSIHPLLCIEFISWSRLNNLYVMITRKYLHNRRESFFIYRSSLDFRSSFYSCWNETLNCSCGAWKLGGDKLLNTEPRLRRAEGAVLSALWGGPHIQEQWRTTPARFSGFLQLISPFKVIAVKVHGVITCIGPRKYFTGSGRS